MCAWLPALRRDNALDTHEATKFTIAHTPDGLQQNPARSHSREEALIPLAMDIGSKQVVGDFLAAV